MFFLQLTNTFQCVIATNETTTYAIFLYNKLTANKSAPAKVGFNDGMYLAWVYLRSARLCCMEINIVFIYTFYMLKQYIGVISYLQRLICSSYNECVCCIHVVYSSWM